VAALLNASPGEIYFTAGATESNNISLRGATRQPPGERNHIITQSTEHHAVLDPLRKIEKEGWRLTVLNPDPEGFISAAALQEVIDEHTLMVSIMAANNEIGTVQPLQELGEVINEAGALLHCDAAQAAGKVELDVEAAGISMLSISGHKFCAPKGVGALYKRKRGNRVRLEPLALGGGQEEGLRPGTLNVPGIVGLGEACRIAREELQEEATRVGQLRDLLLAGVREGIPDVNVNGPADTTKKLPGNLSLSFRNVDGSALIVSLGDLAASAGSACTAGNAEPSYVLKAIGTPGELAVSTLRIGLGRFTTEEEIHYAVGRIIETVEKLRQGR
jgi:cysteine desulfurase